MNDSSRFVLLAIFVAVLLISCAPASQGAGNSSSDSAPETAQAIPQPSPERIAFSEEDVRSGYRKLAPWQDINWTRTNKTEVLLGGTWYDFASINGLAEADLLGFAQLVYKDRWRKRIAEDMVAVLTHMERTPGRTATLVLVDQATGESVRFENVAMTEENRQSVWEARRDRGE